MASAIAAPIRPRPVPLQNGDHLTRAEFERRYEAMPELKTAELIDGVVYMSSPVSTEFHGSPHSDLVTWLGVYRSASPASLQTGDNSSMILDSKNEPQPDAFLRVRDEHVGQSRTNQQGYLVGAPELVVEVAASSASYDLHVKLDVYRRFGVREYIVWRVYDQAIDWFILREGRYERLPASEGVCRSETFPGLWLDIPAMIRGDIATVLQVLQRGLASPEHVQFVQRLASAAGKT